MMATGLTTSCTVIVEVVFTDCWSLEVAVKVTVFCPGESHKPTACHPTVSASLSRIKSPSLSTSESKSQLMVSIWSNRFGVLIESRFNPTPIEVIPELSAEITGDIGGAS